MRPFILLLLWFLPGLLHGEAPAFRLEDTRRALLAGLLRERNIPFEERPLFAEYGGFGSSLHVLLPAAPNGTGTFILAVPLSFTGDDHRELPYAFETALAFIDTVREAGQRRDILVAFLADEWSALPQGDTSAGDPHLGLRDLYSRLELPEDTAMVYLDMYAEAGELVIHHGARRALAPLNLLRGLVRLCDSSGIPYALAVGSNELYKLAWADGPSALTYALNRELPALYLNGGPDAPGVLARALLDYAASLPSPGTESPDYHYLIFQPPLNAAWTFFVPEYTTVLIFLVFAALFFLLALVYSVVFRLHLVLQWRVFLNRSWILLMLYILLVLSLMGAALVFRLLTRGAGDSAAGDWFVYGTTAAELLFGVALFTFLSPVVNLVYVPRRASFYGSSAVILLGLGILLAAFFDITFIPIFIGAFIFTFLGACF